MSEEIELRDGVCCKHCYFTKSGFFSDTTFCTKRGDEVFIWKLCNRFVRKEDKE